MIATRNAPSNSKLRYQINKILTTKELQNAVNILMDWLRSRELRMSYYHFILICDILQSIGIKINNDDIGLKYVAAYLLLSKVEDIINISTDRYLHKNDQKIKELIYTAFQDSLENLDFLNIQLFTIS